MMTALRRGIAALLILGAASAAGDGPIVLGHYRNTIPPEAIPYERLSHVTQYGAWPGPDGLPVLAEDGRRGEFIRLCREGGALPILILTDPGKKPGMELYAVARSVRKRRAFCDALARMVRENGFAGIDLDWEFPVGPFQAWAWNDLVAGMDEALARDGGEHLVFVSLPYWGAGIPWRRTVEKHVDCVDVMTYDYFGPTWGSVAGNQAPLRPEGRDGMGASIAASMKAWKRIPRERIAIGLPFYAYTCWGLEPGEKIDRTRMAKSLVAYREAPEGRIFIDQGTVWSSVQARFEAGWRREFHEWVPSSWFFSPDGRGFIAADDPEVIRAKSAWAIGEGYAGVFAWYLGADMLSDGSMPLLEAMAEGARAGAADAE